MDAIRQPFQTLYEELDNHAKEFSSKCCSVEKAENFNLDEYWSKISNYATILVHICTKLKLVAISDPKPNCSTCQKMCDELHGTMISIIETFYQVPKHIGVTFYDTIRDDSYGLLMVVKEFVGTLIRAGSENDFTHLGSLWSLSDHITKLPKDNKEACVAFLTTDAKLIDDALEEFQDSLRDDTENWTESERNLLPYCLGLVKAAKSCYKKTIEAINNRGDCKHVSDYDVIWNAANSTSSYVDDFVSELYAPISKAEGNETAKELANHLRQILHAVSMSHCFGEADKQWVNFLHEAIKHNFDKIDMLTNQKAG